MRPSWHRALGAFLVAVALCGACRNRGGSTAGPTSSTENGSVPGGPSRSTATTLNGSPSGGAGGCRFVTLAEARSALGADAKEDSYSATTCVYRREGEPERTVQVQLSSLRAQGFESVGAYISAGDDTVTKGVADKVDGVGEAGYFDKRKSELTFVTGFVYVRLTVSLSTISQDGRTTTDKTKEKAALVALAKDVKLRL